MNFRSDNEKLNRDLVGARGEVESLRITAASYKNQALEAMEQSNKLGKENEGLKAQEDKTTNQNELIKEQEKKIKEQEEQVRIQKDYITTQENVIEIQGRDLEKSKTKLEEIEKSYKLLKQGFDQKCDNVMTLGRETHKQKKTIKRMKEDNDRLKKEKEEQKTINAKQASHIDLQIRVLESQKEDLKNQKKDIQEQRVVLQSQAVEIEEKQKTIEEQKRTIAEQKETVIALTQNVTKVIREREETITTLKKEIEELTKMVQHRESAIYELSKELEELKKAKQTTDTTKTEVPIENENSDLLGMISMTYMSHILQTADENIQKITTRSVVLREMVKLMNEDNALLSSKVKELEDKVDEYVITCNQLASEVKESSNEIQNKEEQVKTLKKEIKGLTTCLIEVTKEKNKNFADFKEAKLEHLTYEGLLIEKNRLIEILHAKCNRLAHMVEQYITHAKIPEDSSDSIPNLPPRDKFE